MSVTGMGGGFFLLFLLTGISILRLFELGFVGKGLNVTANEKMKPVMQNTSQTVQKFSERQRWGGGVLGRGALKEATEDHSNLEPSV